jgi:hypothetical protein
MWNQIWFPNQFDFTFISLKIQNKKLKNVKNQVLTSVRWAFDFSNRLPVSGISKTSKNCQVS